MPINKDDFKKLPPDERIKKLKQLEEENKKELKEAEKLIEESKIEIQRTELSKEEPPEISQFIRKKEEQEDKKNLESTVEHERVPEEHGNIQYLFDQYDELKNFLGRTLNNYDRERVEEIYHNINNIAENYKHTSEELENVARATKRIVKDLLGEYQSNVKYTP